MKLDRYLITSRMLSVKTLSREELNQLLTLRNFVWDNPSFTSLCELPSRTNYKFLFYWL